MKAGLNRTYIYLILIIALAIILYAVSGILPTQQSRHYDFVNITSATMSYDNITSISSSNLPNSSRISSAYLSMPSSMLELTGSNVTPGQAVTVNVQTTYTFNGQAIEFISETPGFTVLNSTYLYPSTKYDPLSMINESNSTQTQSLISPGMLVGYTIYLSTPSTGYYGSIHVVEVINNVDKSGVIAVNGAG